MSKIGRVTVSWLGPDPDDGETPIVPARGAMRQAGMVAGRGYATKIAPLLPLFGMSTNDDAADVEVIVVQMDPGGPFSASCEVGRCRVDVAEGRGPTWQTAMLEMSRSIDAALRKAGVR